MAPSVVRAVQWLLLAPAIGGMRTDQTEMGKSLHAASGNDAAKKLNSATRGGATQTDKATKSVKELVSTLECDFPDELKNDYTMNFKAGQGMSGCAYIATRKSSGTKVVIKIPRYTKNAGNNFKYECVNQMQAVHKAACKAGPEHLALVEQYLPTCLEFGEDPAYLVMQAANTDTLKHVKKLKLTKEEAKEAFAQIVASFYAMHSIGFAHNDAHAGNIMCSREGNKIRVSLIDFGRTKAMDWAEFKNNRHCDAFEVVKHLQKLSHCKKNFNECLKRNWSVDDEFLTALEAVTAGCDAKKKDQHIRDIYGTSFVQNHLPPKQVHYHLPGSCER